MPITPIWLTGFEHGILNANGGSMYQGVTGTPALESTIVHSGSYSLKLNPTGSGAINVRHNMSASNQIAVVRGYMYVPTGGLPTANASMFGWQITTANVTAGINLTTTGSIRAVLGSGSATPNVTFSLDAWHLIDMRLNITGTTWTLDWYFDEVSQTQATWSGQATNDSLAYIRMGSASTSISAVTYFDDIVLSETSADYPIGSGGTAILVPTSDGTHNAGTNTMEDNAGTDIGATTAYDKIDAVPITSATTYIRQATIGTGNYAEVLFGDMTGTFGRILGASGILAYTAATTSADTGGLIISKDNFSTWTAVWGESGALQDYSDGSTSNLFYKYAMLAGVDTLSEVNALKARLGYSNDVTPNPYWANVVVEVAYDYVHEATLTKTLGTMTASSSGTVGGGANNATVNKTLGSLTRSIAGTVEVKASLTKTLGAMTSSSASKVDVKATVTKTLGSLTSSSTSKVNVNATLIKTLGSMTGSASAITVTNASLIKTLGTLAESSTGTVSVSGTLSKTLGALTTTSSGTVSVSASLAKTLGTLTSSSQATVAVIASLTKTLGALLSSAATTVLIRGTTSKTLGSLTSSSVGDVDVKASLIKTLGTLVLTSNATEDVKASLIKTLGALSLSSQGGSASFANLTQVLGALAASSEGDVAITASLQKTLGSLASSSEGDILVRAALTKSLGQLLVSSTGTVDSNDINATLNEVLESLTSSITATADIKGTLSKVLGNLSEISAGKVSVQASTNKTLGSLTSSSSGVIIATGQVNVQLGSATLTSNAFVGAAITATLIATLGEMTLDGQGGIEEALRYNVIAFITTEVNNDTYIKMEENKNLMMTEGVDTSTFVS